MEKNREIDKEIKDLLDLQKLCVMNIALNKLKGLDYRVYRESFHLAAGEVGVLMHELTETTNN